MFKFHLINSSNNPIFKDLKVFVKNGDHKDFGDLFCVAGLKNNLLALQNNCLPHSVFINTQINQKIVNQIKTLIKNHKVRWIQLSQALTSKVNELGNGNDVFFYYDKKVIFNRSFLMNNTYNYVLCDHLQDPHNFGAIIRNAAAFNVAGIFSYGCPNLWNPKLVRASAGTLFKIPISLISNWNDFVAVLQKKQLKLVITARDLLVKPIGEYQGQKGLVIAFGNEGHGLSEEVIKAANSRVWIKINEKVESLNVASVSGIILYELNQDDHEKNHC